MGSRPTARLRAMRLARIPHLWDVIGQRYNYRVYTNGTNPVAHCEMDYQAATLDPNHLSYAGVLNFAVRPR